MKTKSLLFFNLYWIFGILYFCLGRYEWHIPSYFLLLFYVFLNFLALNLGYFTGTEKAYKTAEPVEIKLSDSEVFNRCKKWFAFACCLTMFFQIAWVIVFQGSFSVSTIVENIGVNYFNKLDAEFDKPVFVMQLRTLLWFVTYFVFPIGFMYFKVMSKPYKLLFALTVIVEILASLNMGISKNLGDLVFIYLATLFLKTAQKKEGNPLGAKIKKSPEKKQMSVFWKIFLTISLFLLVFSTIQSMRQGAMNKIVENPFSKFSELRSFSLFDLFFFWNDSILGVLDSIGEYVSHAYCGLAYALELPFENTYGMGFSSALMDYAEQYFSLPNLRSSTYNGRIDLIYGWKDGQWWPTAFTWFGNAVSLWLVPIVMFLFGRLFKNVERRWFKSNQILSLVMYCQLFIMFVYLSCNAQIFQGRQYLIATAILFLSYFLINVVKIRFRFDNGDKKKTK